MSDEAAPSKRRKATEDGRKAERLAEALRANLARRKARARARARSGRDDKEQG
jgi:hypothetical protein